MSAARILPSLLILGSIWGLSPAIAKKALAAGMPGLGFGFWAALGSALLLATVCLIRRIPIRLDRAHLRYYAGAGLMGFALANLIAYTALPHIPAGFFALLMPLVPMLTVTGASLLGQERLNLRSVGGTVLGFAGVALAMAPGAALPDPSLIGWALFAALCPVCYATSNLIGVQWAPRGTQPLGAAAGALFAASLFLGVMSLASGQFHVPGEVPLRTEALLPLQMMLTGMAYLLYFRLLVTAGSVTTSQSGYIVTIMGVVWGVVLFEERMGILTLPAAALVFSGLWLVTNRR
ncbi:DMT family transporter [Roseococcus pinisoli]|uniref:DMT family transporter n=1 Tax=Roseococcus pinisoli TaxID=2835040 RepID=A0ABS5QKC3_9PROT|nr:DMT family transporter [Roseococcus pinisoli]MBS7813018.1 DMT family transporter [Roseococcus pinisoli]